MARQRKQVSVGHKKEIQEGFPLSVEGFDAFLSQWTLRIL
jgi:hypothetical protein